MDLSEKQYNELPVISSQFGSITNLFATQEKTVNDVIGDVIKYLNFDVIEIDDHLEVFNLDAMNFDGSNQDGL